MADLIRPKVPKLAAIMDEAENDVLAYMTTASSCTASTRSSASRRDRTQDRGINIFPNHDAMVRLVGELLLEQNDEWVVQAMVSARFI
nr:transposase [Mesorhizobium caraganae]